MSGAGDTTPNSRDTRFLILNLKVVPFLLGHPVHFTFVLLHMLHNHDFTIYDDVNENDI